MKISKLKTAVLYGGIGQERKVSIQSGKSVYAALKDAGFDVVLFDITPDNMRILDEPGIDVFFLALHGKFGEDGQLQRILEDKGLVYTGSGPEASRLGFNKMLSKKAFADASVAVPQAIEFNNKMDFKTLENKLRRFSDRFVIKPIEQGSSVGVEIVKDYHKVMPAAKKCLTEFGDCMIEQFIEGREITVGILFGQALPIIEIRPKEEFYDYHAKYIDDRTEFLFGTINDDELEKKIKQAAQQCFNAIGCRGFARIDFIIDNCGEVFALEANTLPGFTNHSLPKAAAETGLSMSDLCAKIIIQTFEDKKRQRASLKAAN